MYKMQKLQQENYYLNIVVDKKVKLKELTDYFFSINFNGIKKDETLFFSTSTDHNFNFRVTKVKSYIDKLDGLQYYELLIIADNLL